MRRTLAFLIVLAACSKDSPTGVTPVASVTLSVSAGSIAVGQSLSLSVTLKDAQGIALTGRTVSWTTSAPAVATVSSAGVVLGVAAGQSTITATSEGKSAAATVTVTGAGPNCTGVNPVSVAVGEVHTLTAAERQVLCLAGGTTGGEYLLIPFSTVTDTLVQNNRIAFTATATGTSAVTGSPAIAVSTSLRAGSSIAAPARRMDHAFEVGLRQRARRELGPVLRTLPRGARPAAVTRPLSSLSGRPGPIQGIKGLAANPTVGSTVTLNANALSTCSNPSNRTSRVAAVSNNAIVLVDNAAPAGGFTDAEYLSLATTFDTLVFGLDTTAFGRPADMDGNGKIALFFTTAVNALTPPSANGIVGGFFFERDLFPVVATQQVPFSCPTSNEGEMFYLPVVDPNAQFNQYFTSKDTLQREVIGTLAHEFQHLINASRRMYVTVADVDFEVVWLNEGMSHIAEELLYYRVTGLGPKQDINFQVALSRDPTLTWINAYQVDNLGRLFDYLSATDVISPYARNDSLATRGATWNLLRLALDQSPLPSAAYLRALVDSDKWGQPNFNDVFSGLGGLVGATRQEVIADFFDNSGITIASPYSFPSWNFRDLLPRISTANPKVYPLITKALLPGSSPSYSLVGGGSGYLRFRVNSGATAGIATAASGGALPGTVELILIRTQ